MAKTEELLQVLTTVGEDFFKLIYGKEIFDRLVETSNRMSGSNKEKELSREIFKSGKQNVTFVSPSKDAHGQLRECLETYVSGIELGEKLGFYRGVLSCVMARLPHIGAGVGFSIADLTEAGNYCFDSNKINLNRNIALSTGELNSVNIIAHEAYHKHQFENNKQAKLFSRKAQEGVVFNDDDVYDLCGFNNDDKKRFYYMSKSERQAFSYGDLFAQFFVQSAIQFLSDNPQGHIYNFLERDINRTTKNNRHAASRVDSEMYFLNPASKNVAMFYCLTQEPFEKLVEAFLQVRATGSYVDADDLDEHYNPEVIGKSFGKRLRAYAGGAPITEELLTKAMAQVIGLCPQKERVETFVNLVATSRQDLSGQAVESVFKFRVPIVESDYLKLALTCPEEQSILPGMFQAKALGMVYEPVWVKAMVSRYGVEFVGKLLDDYIRLEEGAPTNINYSRASNALTNFQQANFTTQTGETFSTCHEVLQMVLNAQEQLLANAPEQEKAEHLSQIVGNMANIIDNFQDISFSNPEFVQAITSFISNPTEQQFAERTQRSEIGQLFVQNVSEHIAGFLGAMREQQTTYNPYATNYTYQPTPIQNFIKCTTGEVEQGLDGYVDSELLVSRACLRATPTVEENLQAVIEKMQELETAQDDSSQQEKEYSNTSSVEANEGFIFVSPQNAMAEVVTKANGTTANSSIIESETFIIDPTQSK